MQDSINSCQAIDGQGGQLTIATAYPETEAELTLTDTGSGIPPHIQARVFEPFMTTKPTGTGLGLTVVRSILQEHQGTITVASAPGQGTTVTITLPVASESGVQ